MTTVFHCRAALVDGRFAAEVTVTVADGRVAALTVGAVPEPHAIRLGVVVPGFVNAHSHAFHRALRGRTHADGGDFWRWRERMYETADALTPDSYEVLATAVFAQMREAGYTRVAEFHYLHHRPGGEPYPDHDMERALARAARAAGIRLLLLDTCYLAGGIGVALSPPQRRFSDGTGDAWLDRWRRLRAALEPFADTASQPGVTVGAAIHSARAVTPPDLRLIAAELARDVPLHVHLSENPAENEAALAAYGMTPTALLAQSGLLSPRLSVVHATHLTAQDIALLGEAGVTVVMCPTTEADLGDGIGPAPELRDAGARIAIGSDQHATIDPWEELARLELDQRLRLRRRGVFSPAQLWSAGAGGPGLRVGAPFDAVEVDADTARTRGADLAQLPLVAREGDVRATIVGGRLWRRGGQS